MKVVDLVAEDIGEDEDERRSEDEDWAYVTWYMSFFSIWKPVSMSIILYTRIQIRLIQILCTNTHACRATEIHLSAEAEQHLEWKPRCLQKLLFLNCCLFLIPFLHPHLGLSQETSGQKSIHGSAHQHVNRQVSRAHICTEITPSAFGPAAHSLRSSTFKRLFAFRNQCWSGYTNMDVSDESTQKDRQKPQGDESIGNLYRLGVAIPTTL